MLVGCGYITGPVASLPADSLVLTGTSVPSRLDVFTPATRSVTPPEIRVRGEYVESPGSDKIKQPG